MVTLRKPVLWCVVAAMAAGLAALAAGQAGPAATQPALPPSASAPAAPKPGQVFTDPTGLRLGWVPPGEFLMGSPAAEPGRHEDERQHPVRISRGFWLGVTEVTQAQWQAVMGFNRSGVKGDALPATKLSWPDAAAFCRKLSQKEGCTYRLPTEAEWEYACRAGAAGPFAGSGALDEMGWHMDNSDEAPHAVAAKKPNAWGLYDMHGNVMEWCADWYERDCPAAAPASDPRGPGEGKYRVARGGSFGHFRRACRSAARASCNPAYQLDQLGLRVLREADPNQQRS